MNKNSVLSALVAGFLFGLTLLPRPVAGKEVSAGPLRIDRVAVGLRGRFKLGLWTPVVATVSTDRRLRVRLEITAPDPDGNPVTFPSVEVELAAGTHQLRGLFQSGRLNAALNIAIHGADGLLASQTVRPSAEAKATLHRTLSPTTLLVATLGKPSGFVALQIAPSAQTAGRSAGGGKSSASLKRSIQVVELDGPNRLPVEPLAYESWDALVIAGSAEVDTVRNRALRTWVRSGGHLILAVGGHAVANYQRSRLARWVPVAVTGTSSLRQLTGLESFSGGKARLPLSRPVSAAQLGDVEGLVLFSELGGPLSVRVPYGFGRVTFLGLDLTKPPFRDWDGLPQLAWKLIVGKRVESRSKRRLQQGRLTRSGVGDLASQLHSALDHFPEIQRGSLWSAMVLMLVYLAAIGPLDYLLVHRILKRPRLTWITFPILVVLAGGLIVRQAQKANGDRLLVSQINLVDIDAASGEMQTRTWANLYSPRTARYGVAVEPVGRENASTKQRPGNPTGNNSSTSLAESPSRVSWFGIPETGFGGMYHRGGFDLGRAAYRFAPRAHSIDNLPIPLWTTKTISAVRRSTRNGLVESRLETAGGGGRLTGTIVHHLSAPLQNWFIAYGNSVYRPRIRKASLSHGDLPPGRRWSLSGLQVESRELTGFLTGSIAVRYQAAQERNDTIRNIRMPWNPDNRNPDDILRILTFHEIVGGKSYTGLGNDLLRPLDLSPLVWVHRAVLFGTIDVPVARLMLTDGTSPTTRPVKPTRNRTYVRIVLPVKQTSSEPQKLAN